MGDLDYMNIEKFRLWSEHALKVYLSCRKQSVSGSFEELSARAFCTWERDLPVDLDAESAELRLGAQYKAKLKAGGNVIPDPFSIQDKKWTGEKEGMSLWPPIYISDIALYLNGYSANDIVHRLLNEYKEGKGYRYFQCEWVKEVLIHQISEKHPFCLLKARVTPSQAINCKNYFVWICAEKDRKDCVGGRIVCAYCTCTAGMLGSCNHIAGVLFRIEHFVKLGLSRTITCTDILSEWNVPKQKTTVEPMKVQDILWRKGHYSKLPIERTEEVSKMKKKQAFTPLNKDQEDEVMDGASMRKKLHEVLKDSVPSSCFVANMEKKRLSVPKLNIPEDYSSIAKSLNPNDSVEEKMTYFKKKLQVTEAERSDLKVATTSQNTSSVWHQQRKGRVTASNFSRVSSRVDSLRRDPDTHPTKLLQAVLGDSPQVTTKAMKHGISLEPHAKRAYILSSRKLHRRFSASDTGMLLDKTSTFIAASPDLQITCACCGDGLCEIKCPYSAKSEIPSEKTVEYLHLEEGKLTLKRNHPYYFQIQGQLGISEKLFCDLFVFTFHGHVTIRITFDPEFWSVLKGKLEWFWEKYVLRAIVEQALQQDENVSPHEPQQMLSTSAPTHQTVRPPVRRALMDTINTPAKKKKKRGNKRPVYLCGTCSCDVTDSPKTDSDQSVQCDGCSLWFHFVCTDVDIKSIEAMEEWHCDRCK